MSNPNGYVVVADRLRELRLRKNLSQKALAKKAGLSLRRIGQLERPGQRSGVNPDTIGKLEAALDAAFEDFADLQLRATVEGESAPLRGDPATISSSNSDRHPEEGPDVQSDATPTEPSQTSKSTDSSETSETPQKGGSALRQPVPQPTPISTAGVRVQLDPTTSLPVERLADNETSRRSTDGPNDEWSDQSPVERTEIGEIALPILSLRGLAFRHVLPRVLPVFIVTQAPLMVLAAHYIDHLATLPHVLSRSLGQYLFLFLFFPIVTTYVSIAHERARAIASHDDGQGPLAFYFDNLIRFFGMALFFGVLIAGLDLFVTTSDIDCLRPRYATRALQAKQIIESSITSTFPIDRLLRDGEGELQEFGMNYRVAKSLEESLGRVPIQNSVVVGQLSEDLSRVASQDPDSARDFVERVAESSEPFSQESLLLATAYLQVVLNDQLNQQWLIPYLRPFGFFELLIVVLVCSHLKFLTYHIRAYTNRRPTDATGHVDSCVHSLLFGTVLLTPWIIFRFQTLNSLWNLHIPVSDIGGVVLVLMYILSTTSLLLASLGRFSGNASVLVSLLCLLISFAPFAFVAYAPSLPVTTIFVCFASTLLFESLLVHRKARLSEEGAANTVNPATT